jgi:glutathione synthase
MDPIETIKPWKDSSLAMLLEAQTRGWQIYYFELDDVFFDNGIATGQYRRLSVYDDNEHWFDYGEAGRCRLDQLDTILMRKDPPFDLEYIYCSYLLEQAEENGVLVVNRPASLPCGTAMKSCTPAYFRIAASRPGSVAIRLF